MANSEYNLTVVDSTALTISLSGPAGPTGPAGAGGGSSTISTSTLTTLTGYIYGNGTNIAGATAATSADTANTLVKRDEYGIADFSSLRIENDTSGLVPISCSGGVFSFGYAVQIDPATKMLQLSGGGIFQYTFPNANGKVPVYTGAAAIGKVLTSSGTTGVATWTTAPFDPIVVGIPPILKSTGVIALSPTLPDAYAFTSPTRPTAVNTSAPAPNSLMTYTDVLNLTLRDARTYNVNYALGTPQTASGGTSSASRGYWQLFTSTASSSKAQIIFDMGALVGIGFVINFDRRMIVNTRISPSTLRSGLQYYCQVGRTVSDGSAAQLSAKKGFGYGLSGSTITPFVNNGSGITNGTTFSVTTYPFITMDFVAGVALYVYGQTLTSATPVLLSTISTGLPSGNSTASDGQLEFLVYDTGSGGANNWFYLGNASMTIL